jgi:hypothetical protein
VQTLADCTAGLLLRPSYDPVTRTVTYYLGSSSSRLAPDTFYRLTVLTADPESGDFGMRAFDGAPLEGNHVVDFVTAADDPALATESPPEGALFCGTPACLARCEALEPVDGEAAEATEARRRACTGACPVLRGPLASCGSGGCHAPSASLEPAMGLDLSTGAGIENTARGAIAHQTQRGAQASEGAVSPGTFGRSMPIVAPGDPGRSYLLYKLLASPDFASDATLADGETERLRRAFVVGLPMPPAPFTLPTDEQLRDLVAWIASGAELHDCR